MSSSIERKMKLEKIKKTTDNKITKRTASVISRDTSEIIIKEMEDEWRYLEVLKGGYYGNFKKQKE